MVADKIKGAFAEVLTHAPGVEEEQVFGGKEESDSEGDDSDEDYDMEEEDQSEEEPCEFAGRYSRSSIYIYIIIQENRSDS